MKFVQQLGFWLKTGKEVPSVAQAIWIRTARKNPSVHVVREGYEHSADSKWQAN
jgi:hypothetical protein